ncbi:MAG: hypothetical protein ACFFDN_18140, partial [Candidatus Hodarchaeota archaeon]
MASTKKNKILFIFFLDFILISGTFLLAIYLKRGNLELTNEYKLLLLVFYSIWFISSVLSKKYSLIRPKNLRQGLNPIIRSFLYMAFLLFFIIFIFKLFYYSRFIISVTLLIYFFLEISAYGAFYFYSWGPNVNIINEDYNPKDFYMRKES